PLRRPWRPRLPRPPPRRSPPPRRQPSPRPAPRPPLHPPRHPPRRSPPPPPRRPTTPPRRRPRARPASPRSWHWRARASPSCSEPSSSVTVASLLYQLAERGAAATFQLASSFHPFLPLLLLPFYFPFVLLFKFLPVV
uniref:Uncharacterized protein n=1 Tax=Oryza brachyantha TaxID=4533 RepID=J3LFD3_ORYBR